MDGEASAGVSAIAPPATPSRFELTAADDDAEVRRVLRDNSMGRDIQLTFEREPNAAIAATIEGELHQTIVGRRRCGRLFGVGGRSVRDLFINGISTPVGYLSMLRLDADYRSNPRVLQQAFTFLKQLHLADGKAQIYLTSILSTNTEARRVLERGLRGMPTYRFVGEFVTLAMPVRCGRSAAPQIDGIEFRRGEAADLERVAQLLNESNARRQFAPVWTANDLISSERTPNLCMRDFCLAWRGKSLVACAALWDQRPFKQTVVRGYSRRMARVAWLLNRLPFALRLPAVNQTLAQGFASHVATDDRHAHLISPMIEAIRMMASERDLDYVIAGLPAAMKICKPLGTQTLRSRLYAVHWFDGEAVAASLDSARPVWPEVSLL